MVQGGADGADVICGVRDTPRDFQPPLALPIRLGLLLRDLDLALLTYRPAPPGAMLEKFFLIFRRRPGAGSYPWRLGYTGSGWRVLDRPAGVVAGGGGQ